jgi:DNA-binding transcriptional LysR family regulator
MELRVLRYFLAVAQEENITRAATLLNVTQPTLSRQLIQLEEELGVKLFRRSQYRIILTEDGMLLRRRAQEIVELANKTEQEFLNRDTELSGEISIGCGETRSMTFLSRKICSFRKLHPQVRFRIYSANADDVKERLESGLLDLGLLMEPVDISRYAFLRLPEKERWGVLVAKDSPLAERKAVTPQDLLGVPLLMGSREKVIHELAGWFGDAYDQIQVAGTYNLILNAANMVENGVGAALCFYLGELSDKLRFVPLSPPLETGSVLVWKKDQLFSDAAGQFHQHIKHAE